MWGKLDLKWRFKGTWQGFLCEDWFPEIWQGEHWCRDNQRAFRQKDTKGTWDQEEFLNIFMIKRIQSFLSRIGSTGFWMQKSVNQTRATWTLKVKRNLGWGGLEFLQKWGERDLKAQRQMGSRFWAKIGFINQARWGLIPRGSKSSATKDLTWKSKGPWDEGELTYSFCLRGIQKAKRSYFVNGFGCRRFLRNMGNMDFRVQRNFVWRRLQRVLVWRLLSRMLAWRGLQCKDVERHSDKDDT